jgi:hypothetical protein
MSCSHHKRRNVFKADRPNSGKGVLANSTKLMHQGKAPEGCTITYFDMTGQTYRISQSDIVPQSAIVRDVHVRHQEIIVANARATGTGGRPAIQRAKFPDLVTVTDV